MKSKNIFALLIVIVVAGLTGYLGDKLSSPLYDHKIFGRTEMGIVTDQQVELKVRMDTGAQTASLSAHDIEVFNKGAQSWVRFIIEPARTDGKIHQLERPLKRTARIRKRSADVICEPEESADDCHLFESRPVVELEVCLGSQTKLIEVTLADRSSFSYPMLLGRTAMEQFGVLIDPTLVYTTKPKCDTVTE